MGAEIDICRGGYLLTYLALDWGLWYCVVTIAATHGFAYGLTYATSVAAAIKVR